MELRLKTLVPLLVSAVPENSRLLEVDEPPRRGAIMGAGGKLNQWHARYRLYTPKKPQPMLVYEAKDEDLIRVRRSVDKVLILHIPKVRSFFFSSWAMGKLYSELSNVSLVVVSILVILNCMNTKVFLVAFAVDKSQWRKTAIAENQLITNTRATYTNTFKISGTKTYTQNI